MITEKDERLSDVDLEELSYPDLQHWAKSSVSRPVFKPNTCAVSSFNFGKV